jgi:hypothetical protein
MMEPGRGHPRSEPDIRSLCSDDRMTRGDLLRYAIAYSLIHARKIVRGLRQRFTEEERYASQIASSLS